MTSGAVLLVLLLQLLAGCGSGGSASSTSGGETTSTEATGAGETTLAEATGEGTASAGARSISFDLSPSTGSDARGTASLTEDPQGAVVALDIGNLNEEDGTVHPAQIYEGGTCTGEQAGNGAQVLYPLNPLTVRTYPVNLNGANSTISATNTTLIEGVTLDQLLQGPPKYINVDAAEDANGGPVPSSMLCADLPSNSST